jgi:hypothetical protein
MIYSLRVDREEQNSERWKRARESKVRLVLAGVFPNAKKLPDGKTSGTTENRAI